MIINIIQFFEGGSVWIKKKLFYSFKYLLIFVLLFSALLYYLSVAVVCILFLKEILPFSWVQWSKQPSYMWSRSWPGQKDFYHKVGLICEIIFIWYGDSQ